MAILLDKQVHHRLDTGSADIHPDRSALVAAVVSVLVLKQGKHDRKTADHRYQVFKAKLQTPQHPG